MKWPKQWPVSLAVYLLTVLDNPILSQASTAGASVWTSQRKQTFRYVFESLISLRGPRVTPCRDATRDLWYHGFNNYMSKGVFLVIART